MDKQIYNIAEASSYIGVSRSCIYRLLTSGALIGRKILGKTVFHKTDLDSFLASLPKFSSTVGGAHAA